MKHSLIYLHGFNSASVDAAGKLLPGKQKLQLLDYMCRKNNIYFIAPNLDYTDPQRVAARLIDLVDGIYKGQQPGNLSFIGTSLGGFMAEYMAMLTGSAAIMINPAINPSQSLACYIGVCKNYVSAEQYQWRRENCDLFKPLELALQNAGGFARTLMVDLGDEVLNSEKAIKKYQTTAKIYVYPGGSHRFEHLDQALPIIKRSIMR